ncbi:hypothetical protein M378DRAFT_179616 [Amanita muscaria Koide BX008]|uniref:Uncharacterized protein n=1 Tax=Amanita muscaria (strain Koide BX008) TaxID=946122 RepID=A0A0C2T7Q2_AMAMK|nr:hypothetical protein M378DRAFT_179616 [Amanita muscaria Koide BX008]
MSKVDDFGSSGALWRTAASERYVAQKLQLAWQALLERGGYLGAADSHWIEQLTWERVGDVERLVTEAASEIVAADCWTYFASGWVGPVPSPPSPVVLSAVVTVATDSFCLTSCAMWKGATDLAPSLADAVATCVGGPPEHFVFADDYRWVLANVRRVMDSGRSMGYGRREGLLCSNIGLEFRHRLFEPLRIGTTECGNDSAIRGCELVCLLYRPVGAYARWVLAGLVCSASRANDGGLACG